MVIREAAAGDLEGLLHLYAQLHDNPMPDVLPYALWEEILADKNHHVIVAEQGGAIVSTCVIVVIPNLTHGFRPYALVENVVTDPSFRNRGIATACLLFAAKIAEGRNCYKIMLLTGSRQESTLRFYEKAGFNRHDKTAFIRWLNA